MKVGEHLKDEWWRRGRVKSGERGQEIRVGRDGKKKSGTEGENREPRVLLGESERA